MKDVLRGFMSLIVDKIGWDLPERAYQEALYLELANCPLFSKIEKERVYPQFYKTVAVGTRRIDLLCETREGKKIVIEIKHQKTANTDRARRQCAHYMDLAGADEGYVILIRGESFPESGPHDITDIVLDKNDET